MAGLMDWWQNALNLGTMSQENQKYLQQMYSDIVKGKVSPYDTNLYKTMMEPMQNMMKQQTAEYDRTASAKGITGGAYTQGQDQIQNALRSAGLGAGNQVMQNAVSGLTSSATEGSDALSNAIKLAMGWGTQKKQMDMAEEQAKQQQYGKYISGGLGAMGSMGQSGCSCEIFTEDWTKELEEPVRMFRDDNFTPDSYVSKGYKMMSKWLVPLMMKYKSVRKLVRLIMLKPMSRFATHYYNYDLKAILYAPIGLFWTIYWDLSARVKVAIS